MDIKKAFDEVWHDGLIFKNSTIDVPNQLINLIKSFTSNRTVQIKLNGHRSTSHSIQAGISQGISLFSTFINDMPQHPDRKTALFTENMLFFTTYTSHK